MKKILGTAEDYRRIYGDAPRGAMMDTLVVPSASASVSAPRVSSPPARKSAPATKKPAPKKKTASRPAPKKPA